MTIRVRLTMRNSLLGLITVWVCLCAFTLASFSQLAAFACTEPVEVESPCQEGEEKNSEEKLEVLSSSRRNSNQRRNFAVRFSKDSRKRSFQIASYVSRYRPVIALLSSGISFPMAFVPLCLFNICFLCFFPVHCTVSLRAC